MSIEEELKMLEIRLSRAEVAYRRLMLCAGILLVGWLLVESLKAGSGPEGSASKVVAASQFFVTDPNGNVRATLGVTESGPALFLRDKDGKARAGLMILKGEASLFVGDENCHNGALLQATKTGPVLIMHDADGKAAWSTPLPLR